MPRKTKAAKRSPSGNTKEKILAAAIKVLNEKEYYLSPVDEIAAAAGVAKGTVYLYYKGKEDLYHAVFLEIMSRMKKVAAGALASGPAVPASETLFNFLNKISKTLAEHKNIFLSLARELPMSKSVREKLHEKNREVLAIIARTVEKGVKSGEFGKYPPRLVAAMFVALVSGLAHSQFDCAGVCGDTFPRRTIFDIFLNGIKRRVPS